jgi:hypothetical protein
MIDFMLHKWTENLEVPSKCDVEILVPESYIQICSIEITKSECVPKVTGWNTTQHMYVLVQRGCDKLMSWKIYELP